MGSEDALQPILTVLYELDLLMNSFQAIHTQKISPKVLRNQSHEEKPGWHLRITWEQLMGYNIYPVTRTERQKQ